MSLARLLSRSTRAADQTLRYGDGTEHVMELWRPSGDRPAPAVVVIHGGFWHAAYDRTHVRPLCAAFADSGHLTVAVEYHRVGQRRGGWPGTLQDIADGLDALPGLTDGLVVAERTVLVGHSAGGHLALWAALRHRLRPGNPGYRSDRLSPAGVVSLAGVCDLDAAAALGLGDGAVESFLGGGPAVRHSRYQVANPARLLPMGRPAVLVHGEEDDLVPLEISERFHDMAVAAGDDITLTRLAGVGHFDVIDPDSAAFPAVLDAIRSVAG